MTYTLKVAGLERDLPLCEVNEHLDIAAFIMFSDVELTIAVTKELLAKCPDYDIIITSESKGIPLGYEASRQSGKPYIVARKSVKLYMNDPISASVKSITTAQLQTLYLSGEDAAKIRGKRVLILDDVISTGESLLALEKLVNAAGGIIACRASVLAEGKSADRTDIVYLEKLPVFPK